ncbi:hypothetical protein DPMN_121894 [Dreissena polymorpha]|uniref:Uncharacterized protein n=1 Tax=Dreissena polymorpha TaxID=45954 RepID=A0A9D4GNC4_DREPO|nr:hypothetical protein DPMN_121894 [Dreissena polymorpha]
MRSLGIIHSSDIMKLRVECLKFGGQNLPFQKQNEPKFEISKDVLEGLIEAGFSVLDMSRLLSVSERTVYLKNEQV